METFPFKIITELKTSLETINDVNELNNLKAIYLGKKFTKIYSLY